MNESYKQVKLQDLYVNIFMDNSKFTFIHLADTFIQSDLQLLYMSEVARLWRSLTPMACVLSTAPSPPNNEMKSKKVLWY